MTQVTLSPYHNLLGDIPPANLEALLTSTSKVLTLIEELALIYLSAGENPRVRGIINTLLLEQETVLIQLQTLHPQNNL